MRPTLVLVVRVASLEGPVVQVEVIQEEGVHANMGAVQDVEAEEALTMQA